MHIRPGPTFRFAAQLSLAIAAICVGVILLVSYSQAQDEAARRLAIRNGPPAIATIDAFDATIHEGLAHEVALATQIDRQEVTTGWALLHGNPSRVLSTSQ